MHISVLTSFLSTVVVVLTTEQINHRDIESLGAAAYDFESGVDGAALVLIERLTGGLQSKGELTLCDAFGLFALRPGAGHFPSVQTFPRLKR